MRIPFIAVLLAQILLTGCIGLGVSIPAPTQVRSIPMDGVNFEDLKYFPREHGSQEVVKRDAVKREIRYETDWKRSCRHFFIVLPLAFGDCSRSEVWSFVDSNQITIETHSHRLIGLWCSPIPYAASFPLWDAGPKRLTSINRYFPFCEVHFGTELYARGYTF